MQVGHLRWIFLRSVYFEPQRCYTLPQPLAFSESGSRGSPGIENGKRITPRPGHVAFHLPSGLLLYDVFRTLICLLFEVNHLLNESGDEGGRWDEKPLKGGGV